MTEGTEEALPATVAEPILAPPGAGLPRVELWAARLYFRFTCATTSRAKAAETIAWELAAMERIVQRCAVGRGHRRVLIARLRGLEDSSRYWSVFMTIAHVRIVNTQIHETMAMLLRSEVPVRAASTAEVKPEPAAGADELRKLSVACLRLLQLNAATPTLRTKVRFAHPWFGLLDAQDWFILAGFHMALHRSQLEQIIEALKN